MTFSIRAVIVIAAAANGSKAGSTIKLDRGVPIAHFEMQPVAASRQCAGDEIIQQCLADAAPLLRWIDGEKQELGFIGNRPDQGEAGRLAALFGKGQRNAVHRQNSGALGTGPGFAETWLERGGHDAHDLVEVIDPAAPEANLEFGLPLGCHQAAPASSLDGLASGARA